MCCAIESLCLKSEGRFVCLYKHFVDTPLKINMEAKKQTGQLHEKDTSSEPNLHFLGSHVKKIQCVCEMAMIQ